MEKLTSKNEKSSRLRKAGEAVVGALFAPSQLLTPLMPEAAPDRNRAPGAPTLAEELGGDVLYVRIGPEPIDEAMIHGAAEAVRKLLEKTPTDAPV
jgi:hypothetical protein